MDDDQLLDEARSSIGWFCMSECKALCCRKGSVPLRDTAEVDVVVDGMSQEWKELKLLTKEDNGLHLLHVEKHGCPRLTQDFKCSVYDKRPQACRDFPLYVLGKKIVAAAWCPAVQKGLFEKHFDELKKRGFSIV